MNKEQKRNLERLIGREIRADERRKCVAEIRAMNKEKSGYEWLATSVWARITEQAAKTIERGQS